MSKNDNNNNNNDKGILYFIFAISIVIAILFTATIPKMSYVTNDVINTNITNDVLDVNITSPREENGGLPVNVQDQSTRTIDAYLSQLTTGTPYLLANDTIPNNRNISLVNATGLNAGDFIALFQDSTNPASYFGTIDSITSNTLTMKEPVDQFFYVNLTPILFQLDTQLTTDCSTDEKTHVILNDASIPIDITRLMWSITTDSLPNLGEFGDIVGGLDKGLVLRIRRNDGSYYNIFTFRTNKDLKNFAFDYEVISATNPAQGVNGLSVRTTFGGQEKHGVVLRLNQDESLEILCQDDLSDLLTFQIIAQGHYTQD